MTRVGEVALVGVDWSAGAVWWGAYQLTRLTRAAEQLLARARGARAAGDRVAPG